MRPARLVSLLVFLPHAGVMGAHMLLACEEGEVATLRANRAYEERSQPLERTLYNTQRAGLSVMTMSSFRYEFIQIVMFTFKM